MNLHQGEPLATYEEMAAVAFDRGYEIEECIGCPIQGVLIRVARPTREGETFLGYPVAGDTQATEVIERHYCKGDADDERMKITFGRAYQQMIWAMEDETCS